MLQKFDDKSAGGSTLLKDVENIMQKSASLESHFLRYITKIKNTMNNKMK